MSLSELELNLRSDLSKLNYGGKSWVHPRTSPDGHVYDVVIVGGGQSGLGTAFGLKRERIDNILVIDENPKGLEGPWETYARMMTLRTPKQLTGIDLGIPALTFRAYCEAQTGEEGWARVDKIPRSDWMNYLRWFRKVLDLPVQNGVKLLKIIPSDDGIFRLVLRHIDDKALEVQGDNWSTILARKVVLATGIQGGGQWHTPPEISRNLPRNLYAHTSEPIEFERLRGKSIGILGGGASAFDNANYALSEGVSQVHVFVRRPELPRINPIRQMEHSGLIEHYSALSDAEKYRTMAHFFKFNQPPTNDTFSRAAAWPGFFVHTGSPWSSIAEVNGRVHVTTPKQRFEFDFVILSTGLISDPRLRPELSEVVDDIALWSDIYEPPADLKNPMLDAHPYLNETFGFTPRTPEAAIRLHGLFVFNYSTLLSLGLSASALSGIRYAIPKLVSGIGGQLFLDDRKTLLDAYFNYDEEEFVIELPTD